MAHLESAQSNFSKNAETGPNVKNVEKGANSCLWKTVPISNHIIKKFIKSISNNIIAQKKYHNV